MSKLQRLLYKPFVIRLLNWEFWGFHPIHFCVYPVWFLICIRMRSFFFFSAANPSIENGGFLMESKKKIYDILPEEFYPKTILVKPDESVKAVARKIREEDLKYPLIAKPDIGGSGRGVKKINDETDLRYLKKFPLDMVLQEFVPYKEEVGIFYYRYPKSEKGKISGIVGKHFLVIKGDGHSTIEELLRKKKRYILQIPALKQIMGDELQTVLNKDEERLLVPYGNHSRGTKFVDHSHLADDKLNEAIDGICKKIPGFYYGRLDIRFRCIEELKEGKAFSIIELNGAGSEPTHMYDPSHSIFYAWKEIVKHWIILSRISRQNHKRGIDYMSTGAGIKMFREAKRFDKTIESLIRN